MKSAVLELKAGYSRGRPADEMPRVGDLELEPRWDGIQDPKDLCATFLARADIVIDEGVALEVA